MESHAPEQTWADVKAEPGLIALSIDIHGFDTVTTKEWVKPAMEPSHWDRIVSIAETTSEQLTNQPGFSWVTAVVIDDRAVVLAPPEHLRVHLEH